MAPSKGSWIVQNHEVCIYAAGNNKARQAIRKQLPARHADLPEGETHQGWTAT